MISDKHFINITCLVVGGGFLVFKQVEFAVLTGLIYAVWLTVHNIEMKVNALLDSKGIQVD